MKLERLTSYLDDHKFVYKKIKCKKDINIMKGHGDMYYNNLPLNQQSISVLNTIYHSFDGLHGFSRRKITPSGGVSIKGVDPRFPYYWIKNVERGFEFKFIVSFDFFVYIDGRLYGFTCGQPRREIKNCGGVAVKKLVKCARAIGFDLTKYREKDIYQAMEVTKKSIEHPLIACLYPLYDFEYGCINGVSHLDLNESYRGCIEEKFPEFKALFAEIDKEYPDHQENKDIINMSIGMFQSKYMNYMYSGLSKCAIDGTKKRILDISRDLSKQGYLILGYNTDGIWYRRSNDDIDPVYHGDGEGTKPGQFKTDFTDCQWVPLSAGGNWCVLEGKHKGHPGFWKALRGNYGYSSIKNYEDWDCWEDIVKAMASEEISTLTFDDIKGWTLTKETIDQNHFVIPKVRDATARVLMKKEHLEYDLQKGMETVQGQVESPLQAIS